MPDGAVRTTAHDDRHGPAGRAGSGGSGGPGRPRVVVVGDVINDVLVRPLGPVAPDTDTRAQIVRRPGGSAANLAGWLASLGDAVGFVGRVGAVDHALHHARLESLGIEAHLAVDAERETGTIVVIVDADGGRTMLTDRGANVALTPDDVPAGVLDGAALLHLSGYTLFEEPARGTALDLMARAGAAGVPVSVDPGSVAFLQDVGPKQFLDWTAGAALCFPNRDEAALLAGTPDPVQAAERLCDTYGTVVVTLDADGVVVGRRGRQPVAVPAQRVHAVDTTGAGDAFCAGFLTSWLREDDPVGAAAAGVAIARECVLRLGGGPVVEPV